MVVPSSGWEERKKEADNAFEQRKKELDKAFEQRKREFKERYEKAQRALMSGAVLGAKTEAKTAAQKSWDERKKAFGSRYEQVEKKWGSLKKSFQEREAEVSRRIDAGIKHEKPETEAKALTPSPKLKRDFRNRIARKKLVSTKARRKAVSKATKNRKLISPTIFSPKGKAVKKRSKAPLMKPRREKLKKRHKKKESIFEKVDDSKLGHAIKKLFKLRK